MSRGEVEHIGYHRTKHGGYAEHGGYVKSTSEGRQAKSRRPSKVEVESGKENKCRADLEEHMPGKWKPIKEEPDRLARQVKLTSRRSGVNISKEEPDRAEQVRGHRADHGHGMLVIAGWSMKSVHCIRREGSDYAVGLENGAPGRSGERSK
ncbi:hypothetical protein Dimus_002064 [Dionaea muscipula]